MHVGGPLQSSVPTVLSRTEKLFFRAIASLSVLWATRKARSNEVPKYYFFMKFPRKKWQFCRGFGKNLLVLWCFAEIWHLKVFWVLIPFRMVKFHRKTAKNAKDLKKNRKTQEPAKNGKTKILRKKSKYI